MKVNELFEQGKSVEDEDSLTRNSQRITPHNEKSVYDGNFDCRQRELTSLKGCPGTINGYFICGGNQLNDLQYGPKIVKGDYSCWENHITTLDYLPEIVEGNFDISDNDLSKADLSRLNSITIGADLTLTRCNLKSLNGVPKKIYGSFECSNNHFKDFTGGPEFVYGNFICYDCNKLESIKGLPKFIKEDLSCYDCKKLTNFHDIHKYLEHVVRVDLDTASIKSHVLGFVLVKNIKEIIDIQGKSRCAPWAQIINRYLGKGHQGVMDAQEELIEAGLEEYAQL